MKHITQPDKGGYQVRIVRQGKEYSRYFAHRAWGGKTKSLKAAESWRDQQLAVLGKAITHIIDGPALPNNKSTGIRGITKVIHHDKRRDTKSLVYQVHWKDHGKIKNKKFHVGRVEKVTADMDLHAFRTAIHFRKGYEASVKYNKDFDPEIYKNWRTERVYDDGSGEQAAAS